MHKALSFRWALQQFESPSQVLAHAPHLPMGLLGVPWERACRPPNDCFSRNPSPFTCVPFIVGISGKEPEGTILIIRVPNEVTTAVADSAPYPWTPGPVLLLFAMLPWACVPGSVAAQGNAAQMCGSHCPSNPARLVQAGRWAANAVLQAAALGVWPLVMRELARRLHRNCPRYYLETHMTRVSPLAFFSPVEVYSM